MQIKNIITKALLVASVVASGTAYAITPANTRITNTAQLNYTGLSNPIEASVTITVALTPSAPILSAPADQTTAENQTITYTYTITSGSNGNDIYNLTDGFVNTNLVSTSTGAVFSQGATTITSVTLGATAGSALATAGSSVISVPSDGVADGSVNNIVAGDTVVIDGTVYTVAAISDNGVSASITLTSPLLSAVNIGDLIAEQQIFTARIVDVGSLVTSGATANILMTVTAASNTDAGQNMSDETKTTVVEVTFTKYVRNVTNANGTGGAVSVGGQSFYATAGGVTAKSGDVLEYALVVKAPSADLTGVSLLDSIPAFTAYVASSTTLNGVAAPDVSGDSPLLAGMAVNNPGSVSGTVAATQEAYVTFQVTVE